jgi:gamma-aminobutyric acid type B receptor
VVSYNLIPLELPPLDVDENLLGNLKYVGYTFFGIVAFTVLLSVYWTVYHRKSIVVRAAQPFFLVMVAVGVQLMSSALVPLSFDDGGDPENNTEAFNVGVCMSIPWLAFTGFTITFSALFSKTWRVNRPLQKQGTLRPSASQRKRRSGPFCSFVDLQYCGAAMLDTLRSPHLCAQRIRWHRLLEPSDCFLRIVSVG